MHTTCMLETCWTVYKQATYCEIALQVYRTAQPDAKRQASASALPGEPVQPPEVVDNSDSPVSAPSLVGPGICTPAYGLLQSVSSIFI